MISSSTKATSSSSFHKSPQHSRPGSTRKEISASKSSNVCPSRLGIIMQSVTDKEFLKDVADHVSAARPPSTKKVYDAKWSIFASWCRIEKYNPVSASLRIVADFLLYMFREKKCQVSTIKGYRSMISYTLKFKSGVNIRSDPIIYELIKSFEDQFRGLWLLACVLSSLRKEPYEPLHKAYKCL